MIRFFRYMRKTFMEQNKTRTYLLYAIGEIALVMIGILLALQVNNWNEARKQSNREYELLTQLKGDINVLLEEFDTDITFLEYQITKTDTIIFFDKMGNGKDWNTYSRSHFTANPMVFPTRATFDNLKSIGVEIISDPELRNKITDLYDRKLPRASIWENETYDYQDRIEEMLEQLFDHIGQETDPKAAIFRPDSFEDFASKKELRNALISFQEIRNFLVLRYKDAEVLAEEIINELENY